MSEASERMQIPEGKFTSAEQWIPQLSLLSDSVQESNTEPDTEPAVVSEEPVIPVPIDLVTDSAASVAHGAPKVEESSEMASVAQAHEPEQATNGSVTKVEATVDTSLQKHSENGVGNAAVKIEAASPPRKAAPPPKSGVSTKATSSRQSTQPPPKAAPPERGASTAGRKLAPSETNKRRSVSPPGKTEGEKSAARRVREKLAASSPQK
jgi:hypothetical protein